MLEARSSVLFNLAIAYSEGLCDHERALFSLRSCLRIRKEILGEDHILCAETMMKIGDSLFARSEYQDATEYYSSTLLLIQKVSNWIAMVTVYLMEMIRNLIPLLVIL